MRRFGALPLQALSAGPARKRLDERGGSLAWPIFRWGADYVPALTSVTWPTRATGRRGVTLPADVTFSDVEMHALPVQRSVEAAARAALGVAEARTGHCGAGRHRRQVQGIPEVVTIDVRDGDRSLLTLS